VLKGRAAGDLWIEPLVIIGTEGSFPVSGRDCVLPLYDENRSQTRPIVTWTLIFINVLVFIWQITRGLLSNSEQSQIDVLRFGTIPLDIMSGRSTVASLYLELPLGFPWPWVTILTSMFMHAGLLHIVGNMLFLFVFGDNVEDRFGHMKYLALYLGFGACGALANSWMATRSGVGLPLDPRVNPAVIPAIGASGAIAGALGAYILLYPTSRIVSLVFLGYIATTARIRAVFFIGFWFIYQLLPLLVDPFGGNVAYWAHIGGFIAGLISAIPFRLLAPRVPRRPVPEYQF